MTNRGDSEKGRETVRPLATLIDAANIAQRGLEKRLAGLKLSVAQQRILANVYSAKESLTPSMLAAILLQETHSVSGLLNRLEDRDLITRTRDRHDRRVVWVGLTAEGRRVAEESIRIFVEMAHEFDSVFSRAGAANLIDMVRDARNVGFKIAGVREEVRNEALRRAGAAP